MEKKEKPLERLTAKELREMALAMGGIHGVHGMKKEELIVAIRKAKGLPEAEAKKQKVPFKKKETIIYTKAELKKKVRELRVKKEEALQQQNPKMVEILRKRISRYKKMTRRVTG